MGRKVKRGRSPRPLVTTDDLRTNGLWTERQLDEFLAKVGIEIQPWQRDALLRFGTRRSVGVHLGDRHPDHHGRSAGKHLVHRLTKEIAVALGHEVRDTANGYEIKMAIRDEARL